MLVPLIMENYRRTRNLSTEKLLFPRSKVGIAVKHIATGAKDLRPDSQAGQIQRSVTTTEIFLRAASELSTGCRC